jgi:hypothetical protein
MGLSHRFGDEERLMSKATRCIAVGGAVLFVVVLPS